MQEDGQAPKETTPAGEDEQFGLPILHLVIAGVLGVLIILLLLMGGDEGSGEDGEEITSPEISEAGEKQLELELELDLGSRSPAAPDEEPATDIPEQADTEATGEQEPAGQIAEANRQAGALTVADLEKASSSAYTLQLLAAYRESAVSSYVERYPDLPVTYYRTEKDGFPWYVAVVGLFESRDLAVTGAKKLPQEMIARNPWPKPLKQVQKELKAGK